MINEKSKSRSVGWLAQDWDGREIGRDREENFIGIKLSSLFEYLVRDQFWIQIRTDEEEYRPLSKLLFLEALEEEEGEEE